MILAQWHSGIKYHYREKSGWPGRLFVLLIYVNATVGSIVSEPIGDVGAGDESFCGTRLHQLLKELRARLPCAFLGPSVESTAPGCLRGFPPCTTH
eukprot:7328255-Pyramimonas_sp.AAC.1